MRAGRVNLHLIARVATGARRRPWRRFAPAWPGNLAEAPQGRFEQVRDASPPSQFDYLRPPRPAKASRSWLIQADHGDLPAGFPRRRRTLSSAIEAVVADMLSGGPPMDPPGLVADVGSGDQVAMRAARRRIAGGGAGAHPTARPAP